jgi:hypothetical protein
LAVARPMPAEPPMITTCCDGMFHSLKFVVVD